jgi:hypothetical protein
MAAMATVHEQIIKNIGGNFHKKVKLNALLS